MVVDRDRAALGELEAAPTLIPYTLSARARLLRADAPPDTPLRVRSHGAIRKRPGRTEYQRGIVAYNAQGQAEVRVTGSQGSGILRSMSEANCMVLLDEAQGDVAPGDLVEVLLFDGLI